MNRDKVRRSVGRYKRKAWREARDFEIRAYIRQKQGIENPTPEQIAEARAILAAANKSAQWPKGSNLISVKGDAIELKTIITYEKSRWRELTESELEILMQIPEMKKVMEAGK